YMQLNDWMSYVNTPQTQKELDKIRNSVNRQAPIGSKNWVVKIAQK
ncbi:MAG: transposase, partial [Methylococcales symbiont of Iophon sp. n. MRB-2018]